MRWILILISCVFAGQLFSGTQTVTVYYLDSCQNRIASEQFTLTEADLVLDDMPNPVFKLFRKKQRLNKRITAAVLAFPFPFGIVGLHRIYLGTKPYVPVAYIASLGGVFGILPFIDFCAITFDKKNFEDYRDNGQIFMWLKH
ncbi:MAG: NINE protein [Bacteroidota bacterium]